MGRKICLSRMLGKKDKGATVNETHPWAATVGFSYAYKAAQLGIRKFQKGLEIVHLFKLALYPV